MAKTKAQKNEQMERTLKQSESSATVLIADVAGLPVNDMNRFRRGLKAAGLSLAVVKKRLLRIVFEKQGIALDPKKLEGQAGVVFSPKDATETSQIVWKLAKPHKDLLKIRGGVEVSGKLVHSGEELEALGRLPSREVLLGQLVYMLVSPLRSFMFVLNEKSKK